MINKPVKLTLVIPCYNEFNRLNVGEFYSFIKVNPEIVLCFVNDGSTDKTYLLLSNIKEQHPNNIFILNLKNNVGKAEAVRLGIKYTTDLFDSFYFGYIDADLSAPLTEAVRLLEIAQGQALSFVFGSRVAVFGSYIKRKVFRHYSGRIIATLISLLLKMVIYDTQCGLKIFNRRIAEGVFEQQFISRWLFDVEIIARIKDQYPEIDLPLIMKEIPLYDWQEKGNSKISGLDILKIPLELIKINLKYKKGY